MQFNPKDWHLEAKNHDFLRKNNVIMQEICAFKDYIIKIIKVYILTISREFC